MIKTNPQSQHIDFLVCDMDYIMQNNEPIIRLFGRDENNKRKISNVSNFESRFYIPYKDSLGLVDPRIKRFEAGPDALDGTKTITVISNSPKDVGGRNTSMMYLKDVASESFESDVLFTNRCKIDSKITGTINVPVKRFISKQEITPAKSSKKIQPRIQFGDIETKIVGTIQDTMKGKVPINALTIYDTLTNIYTLFTTLPITPDKLDTIKQEVINFWVESLDTLKSNLETEDNPEKLKVLKKQVDYLTANITRITTTFKVDLKIFPNDEPGMLKSYLSYQIQNRPDIMAGWNYDKFDATTIINRMRILKQSLKLSELDPSQLSEVGEAYAFKNGVKIKGTVVMDLMERYVDMQQFPPSHKSLDYVSKKELGVGKLQVGGHDLYDKDPAKFLAYNVVDTMLCVELDKLLHIAEFYIEIANLTYSNLGDMARGRYVDNLILSFCNGKYALPSRAAKVGARMTGGMVYSPVPGLHKNVLILDFKGMYPSIMKSLNISPETKSPNGDIVAANGVRFSSKQTGIIPTLLLDLEQKRSDFKALLKQAKKDNNTALAHEYDLKQYAVKVISNTFYGVLGNEYFRLADRDVGDAVTSTGRKVSMAVKAFVEGLGYSVIYGDTDSIFVELSASLTYKELKETEAILEEKINEMLPPYLKSEFNTSNCYMSIEADPPFKTLLMLPKKTTSSSDDEEEIQAKKRYSGWKWIDETHTEFIAKGLEIVKRNTAEITRFAQSQSLKLILEETDKDTIFDFLQKLHTDFFSGETEIGHIGKPGSINKPLDEYISPTFELKAALYSNNAFTKEYRQGSTFMVYHVIANVEAIALDYGEQLPFGFELDLETSFQKLVIAPTETILATIGLKWNHIITNIDTSDEDPTDILDFSETPSQTPSFPSQTTSFIPQINIPSPSTPKPKQTLPDIDDFFA